MRRRLRLCSEIFQCRDDPLPHDLRPPSIDRHARDQWILPIDQPARDFATIADDVISGAYWLREPKRGAKLAIVYTGVVVPEALAAYDDLLEDIPGATLTRNSGIEAEHRVDVTALISPGAGKYHPYFDNWKNAAAVTTLGVELLEDGVLGE